MLAGGHPSNAFNASALELSLKVFVLDPSPCSIQRLSEPSGHCQALLIGIKGAWVATVVGMKVPRPCITQLGGCSFVCSGVAAGGLLSPGEFQAWLAPAPAASLSRKWLAMPAAGQWASLP